jgi:hypothetical protein
MGERKFHLGMDEAPEKRAAHLKDEIAAIRERLGEDIAELERRRDLTVAKAKRLSVAAATAAIGLGAVLLSLLITALRKPADKGHSV